MRLKARNIFYVLYRLWVAFAVITCDLLKSLRNLRELNNELGPGSISMKKSLGSNKASLKSIKSSSKSIKHALNEHFLPKNSYSSKGDSPDAFKQKKMIYPEKGHTHYSIKGSIYSFVYSSQAHAILPTVPTLNSNSFVGKGKTIGEKEIIKAKSNQQLVWSNYAGREVMPDDTSGERATHYMKATNWINTIDPHYPPHNFSNFTLVQYLKNNTRHKYDFSNACLQAENLNVLVRDKREDPLETSFNKLNVIKKTKMNLTEQSILKIENQTSTKPNFHASTQRSKNVPSSPPGEIPTSTAPAPQTFKVSTALSTAFFGASKIDQSYRNFSSYENSRGIGDKEPTPIDHEEHYLKSKNSDLEDGNLSIPFIILELDTKRVSDTENTYYISSANITQTKVKQNSSDKSEFIRRFKEKYPIKLWKTLGMLEDAYLENINVHWMKYDPPSNSVHIIFSIVYGIFMIVGCSGNFLVIYMFARCRALRTPPNYLILNLAISDFLMMAKTPIIIINSFYHGPALGQLGCSIYGFVGGLSGTASIMTLASIALDRYYAIVYPLNPFKRTTSRRAVLTILFVWTYAAFFSCLPLCGINVYTSEGYLTSCSFDYLSESVQNRTFIFIFFLAAWVLPLVLILFAYSNIFRIVRAAERIETFTTGNTGPSSGESFKFKSNKGRHRNEVKIAWLAGVLISLWMMAWTPYALVALLGIFGGDSLLTPLVSALPAIFCKTASCVNPFVYSLNHPKFRKELQFCFPQCFRNCRNRQKEARENSFYSAVTYRGKDNSIQCVNQPLQIHRNASMKTISYSNEISSTCAHSKLETVQ